jgi:AcrR family transcriptional regulator
VAAERQKRQDLRGEATRSALIEAAESLFAESGVEGVSTRQIGAAIGSANTNVVAYHFGSKEALIREVYRHRLPAIDRRRRELLDQADAASTGREIAALLRVFFQPLFEQTDHEGRHSYARFIAGLERSGMIATRGDVAAEFPETNRLSERLLALLPVEIAPLFNTRTRLIAGLVSNTLLLIDQEAPDDPALAEALFDNAIIMAATALCADPPAPRSHPVLHERMSE